MNGKIKVDFGKDVAQFEAGRKAGHSAGYNEGYSAGYVEGQANAAPAEPTMPTATDNRTNLDYWYQYLNDIMKNSWENPPRWYIAEDFIYDEEYGEWLPYEVFFGDYLESIEFPKGTGSITDFSKFTRILIWNFISYQLESRGLPTKSFTGTLDVSSAESLKELFFSVDKLERVGDIINTENVKDMSRMFMSNTALREVPKMNTRNVTNVSQMFYYCTSIEEIELDMTSVTQNTNFITNCKALKSLKLTNIKKSLSIATGATLSAEILLGVIQNLLPVTSTQTLTMGSDNLAVISNIYVKITSADGIKPFEVCESTDEGAMKITDYAVLKDWSIK